jgi:CHASE1-domain containing sensor protein
MAWPARFGLLRPLALLVLLAGAVGSVMLANGWDTIVTREHSERLDRLATGRATALEAAMARYEDALHAERALFLASTHVSRTDFETFARNLDLGRRYLGMRGIGWVVEVPRDQLGAFLTSARKDGPADFAVRPPGRRPAHYVVLYNEPASQLRATWGIDARLDPTIRPFLERARDTGRPTLSDRTAFQAGLRPGGGPPVAFVLFVPVYRDGAPTGTVAQRRAAFLGWASGPFRANDFLAETLPGARSQLGVEVFDQSAVDANRIASFPEGFRAGGPDLRTSTVDLAGRHWVVRTAPLPDAPVLNTTQLPAWVVLAAGLLSPPCSPAWSGCWPGGPGPSGCWTASGPVWRWPAPSSPT